MLKNKAKTTKPRCDPVEEVEEQSSLFWSMQLVNGDSAFIDSFGYMIHITKACFGATVEPNSRTLVMVERLETKYSNNKAVPICVLNTEKETVDQAIQEDLIEDSLTEDIKCLRR